MKTLLATYQKNKKLINLFKYFNSILMIVTLFTTLTFNLNAQADKLKLLNQAEDSLIVRTGLIAQAKKEIKVQYFTIDDDEITLSGLALLKTAIQNKVKVKILVDAMHNLIQNKTLAALMSYDSTPQKSYIEIREYNRFNFFNPLKYTKRMHDKALIVDGEYLISGGRNISNGYFGQPAYDEQGHILPILEDIDGLIFESEAVKMADQYFNDLWNSPFVKPLKLKNFSELGLSQKFCQYQVDEYETCNDILTERQILVQKEKEKLESISKELLAEKRQTHKKLKQFIAEASEVGPIKYLYDNPINQKSNLEKPINNLAENLYKFILNAKHEVIIFTPYFIVTPEQEELFKKLKENNVSVIVYTNGKNSNDVPAAHVGYVKTRKLAEAQGVKIREYNGPDTLHAKFILIDDDLLFLGSFNWDYRSQNLNREVGIITEIPKQSADFLRVDITNTLLRVTERSTLRGDKKSLNKDAGDLSKTEVEDLANEIRQGNKNNKIWKILFPLIKKQL